MRTMKISARFPFGFFHAVLKMNDLPSAAEEVHLETINLEEHLIRNPQATYLLRVQGESMIEAGILPGDAVLVERRKEAKTGDIVIAEVDGD